jgi:CrcB protein
MGFYAFLGIGIGAALGAWLRWGLGNMLNPVFPTVPLGTLAANLLGGFLMGLAMQFLLERAILPPELRLAITTGFLGGLTTFSTFSAETAALLLREEYLWSVALVLTHVIGSVTMTLLGMLAMQLLMSWGTPS